MLINNPLHVLQLNLHSRLSFKDALASTQWRKSHELPPSSSCTSTGHFKTHMQVHSGVNSDFCNRICSTDFSSLSFLWMEYLRSTDWQSISIPISISISIVCGILTHISQVSRRRHLQKIAASSHQSSRLTGTHWLTDWLTHWLSDQHHFLSVLWR